MIDSTSAISLAANSGIYIQAINGVKIGKHCLLASGTKIISANHELDDYEKQTKNDPIIIGDNCWIGANSVILPGVTIGDGAVVGANAVVTKDVPPYAIVVGVSARAMKKRFSEEVSDKLLTIKWWDLDRQVLQDNIDLFKKELTLESLSKL